mgnify:CR=1 FL=1
MSNYMNYSYDSLKKFCDDAFEKFGFTTEEARNYLVSLFEGFDSELASMVAEAFDNEWIDFYPRDGKVGGAFDCGVPSAKVSRVLTNFDGLFGDIVTLAHAEFKAQVSAGFQCGGVVFCDGPVKIKAVFAAVKG